MPQLTITALPGMPLIQQGDDLARLIVEALTRLNLTLQNNDVLVITSKIVSKAQGRRLDLRTVTPSAHAEEIAAQTDKDPRLVEVILNEAAEISRMRRGAIITRHKLGFISANAGIDHSNVGADGEDWILLLPVDPDGTARQLRDQLLAQTGAQAGIVISDTHGRPFRMGNVGTAIGSAGFPALWDLRGRPDLFNRQLQYTDIGLADELAAAADLLSGQANEGLPVTLIRGLQLPEGDGRASDLIRPPEMNLYR
ncbi:MAG: coenzyme F420-0:L-glutamate ligase [Anaerolineae bacterium]|nr:coenzyme F420-0:L-glutamate ligase [Anaerolineae bacterium]